jgi:hypothetical protein
MTTPNLTATTRAFLDVALRVPYDVFGLAGDASSRRYYRIVAADRSLVLMQWDPFRDDGSYPFLSVLRHFQQSSVAVPAVIAVGEAAGAILLEDLGDITLERKFWDHQDPRLALPFYHRTLEQLHLIHTTASRSQSDPKPTCFRIEFNTERLLWEMSYGREHVFEKLLKLSLSPGDIAKLESEMQAVCERLHLQPKVICHRDFHARNVMIKFDRARIIDFQDARLGPIQYDLVSLLRDSYVTMPSDLEERLLTYYLDLSGARLSDEFREIFELQAVQRCFKACGSFASFWNLRSDRRYLKYLRPTLARVEAALKKSGSCPFLLTLLTDGGLSTRDYEFTEAQ